MITTLEVKRFRGVKGGKVEGLSGLSLLVGPNNSGKSTCLEALAIASRPGDPNAAVKLLLRRGGPPQDALERVTPWGAPAEITVVPDSGNTLTLTIVALDGQKTVEKVNQAYAEGLRDPLIPFALRATRKGTATLQNNQSSSSTLVDSKGTAAVPFTDSGASFIPWPCDFVDVEAIRGEKALESAYSSIESGARVAEVVKALRTSMPGLKDFKILMIGSEFVLHAIFEDGTRPPLPVYLAGDGFKRFLELANGIALGTGGLVLLEEPECFQHPRYLKEIASLLVGSAKAGTQVIMSTHSNELIDELFALAGSEMPILTTHRLRLVNGVLSSTVLNQTQSIRAREELLQDLRA